MSDFQEGPENSHQDSGDNTTPPAKKPNVFFDVLVGVGISAAAYISLWVISSAGRPLAVIALLDFIILAAFLFLTVKFFRTGHTVAGLIMIVAIAPGVFALLLFGACSLMFLPH